MTLLLRVVCPALLCLHLTALLPRSTALLPLPNADQSVVPRHVIRDRLPRPQNVELSAGIPSVVNIPPAVEQPGAYIQIGQSGLNYAGNVTIDFLAKHLTTQSIPNKKGSKRVIGIKYNYEIYNMQIRSFTSPVSSVSMNPNSGITWSLSNAAVKLTGNWKYDRRVIRRVRRSGTFELSTRGVSIAVGLAIGKNGDGKPTISVRSCSCSISRLDIKFRGNLSWLLNIFSGLIERAIKSDLQRSICRAAEESIRKDAATEISTFTTSAKIGNLLLLDFRLVRNPIFTSSYLQTAHRGEVNYAGDSTPNPLYGSVISTVPPTKMVSVYLSEFVFNNMGHVLYKNQFFERLLKADTIPDRYKNFLLLECQSTTCFGNIFPDAAMLYPNASIELYLRATEAPKISITSQRISSQIKGVIEATARNTGTGIGSLLMRLNISAVIDIRGSIDDNRLKAKIVDTDITIATDFSSISLPPDFLLEPLVNWVAESFAIPKFDELGERGIEIPKVRDVEFVNPTITLIQNALIVATDVTVSV